MKAKTKFLRMFNKLPKRARAELIYDFTLNPMSLHICWDEVKYDTEKGKEILARLGYRDD